MAVETLQHKQPFLDSEASYQRASLPSPISEGSCDNGSQNPYELSHYFVSQSMLCHPPQMHQTSSYAFADPSIYFTSGSSIAGAESYMHYPTMAQFRNGSASQVTAPLATFSLPKTVSKPKSSSSPTKAKRKMKIETGWRKADGRTDSTTPATLSMPGPIPATKPLVVHSDHSGVQWISFEYSRDRIKAEYRIRCDVETVNPARLAHDFKQTNCVYPRAYEAGQGKTTYRGNRLGYETECNIVGWALAELNPELRGKRGLIQRAVDSWRNSSHDKNKRSRRVRRMDKAETKKAYDHHRSSSSAAATGSTQRQQQQQQHVGSFSSLSSSSASSIGGDTVTMSMAPLSSISTGSSFQSGAAADDWSPHQAMAAPSSSSSSYAHYSMDTWPMHVASSAHDQTSLDASAAAAAASFDACSSPEDVMDAGGPSYHHAFTAAPTDAHHRVGDSMPQYVVGGSGGRWAMQI